MEGPPHRAELAGDDLGRPERFTNMLRVCKPTSPMSVGSWLLAGYVPSATVAALADVSGVLPGVGGAATGAAAVLGPAVATDTGALVANTAVPAWHDGRREMPLLSGASAASSAAGRGLLAARHAETAPVRRLAVAASVAELAIGRPMRRPLHPAVGKAYETGTAGRLLRTAEALTAAGTVASLLARRSRLAAKVAGAALLPGSACTRFGIVHAGLPSAADPEATVQPQRPA